MSNTAFDPWAEDRANGRRGVMVGVVLVCITAVAISQAGIVVMLCGLGAAALVLAGINDWLGQRGQRKRLVGVTVMCGTLLATGGGFGVIASVIIFATSWRLFGIYQPDTLPQGLVDPRAGWRFGSTWGGLAVAFVYGTWALSALHLVPISVVVKGAVPGLLIALGVVPFAATFREFDDRWTFVARCVLLAVVVATFTVLRDVLPGAYVAPIELQDYEFRAELWAFTAALFLGLSASVYLALPSRRHFGLRRGHAREFGMYLYAPKARARERARRRAAIMFRRSLRRMSLVPDHTWAEATRTVRALIETLQPYTIAGHGDSPPPEVAAADATITAANQRTVDDLEQLAEILRTEDSEAFIAWKIRFEAKPTDGESLDAMRAIVQAAAAVHVAAPRDITGAIRLHERLRERERMARAMKAAQAES